MKKLFTIRFAIESMDFFALTPFIVIDKHGFALAWFKWAFTTTFNK